METEERVPLVDLNRQHDEVAEELEAAWTRVRDSGQFILGEEVAALEREVADLVEVDHAIGCASGSDALSLVLAALDVGPGDEVIVPTFTFFATAGAVARLGARPVFCDIEEGGFGLDPAGVEEAIGPATKAVIAVHLFGEVCAWREVAAVCRTHEIPVIEDAAQAIGARHGDRPAGSLGLASCFSFFPTKNLGALGDAGLVATGDDELADRVRRLRVHGDAGGYDHVEVGWNSRLDALQAAFLRVKLPRLETWNGRRREHAALLDAALEDLPPTRPARRLDRPSIYHQYTIRTAERDGLRAHLADRSIDTGIYYPRPLHLQPCFADLGGRAGDHPRAEKAAAEVLSLPVHPQLEPAQVERVGEEVRSFFETGRA